TDPLASLAELAREARMLHVDWPEPAPGTPAEPRIAELVVDDAQRVVAVTRIDVVEPRRTRLVEVLVGVDHRGHVLSLPPAGDGLHRCAPGGLGLRLAQHCHLA